MVHSAATQASLGAHKAAALLTQQCIDRQADVVIFDIGMTAQTTLAVIVFHFNRRTEPVNVSDYFNARHISVYQKHGGALQQRLVWRRDRHHD